MSAVDRSCASTQNGWSHSGKDPAAVAFDESLVGVEDIDFGRRLKAYGRRLGKRYGTIGPTGSQHPAASSIRSATGTYFAPRSS